jgi:hypothetical protein
MKDISGSKPNHTDELSKLIDQSQVLGDELYQLYGNYLTALAKALNHQAIQASYHICTTCYPSDFLQLDGVEQQRLQRALRRAITNSIIDLLSQRQPIKDLHSPQQLVSWMQTTEEAIEHTLPRLSKKLNYLLQQARIIPQQVPRQLLEAAVKADEVGDSSSKRPNILSVLVEKDSKEDAEATFIIPVHVIFLRLAEIEFAAIELTKFRQQLHETRSKVADLRRAYQHRQRQVHSAAAESAWHQSWFGTENEPDEHK